MAVVYSTPHSGTPLRSLEKVLEDAQMTGVLNIGGRNMREYPQIAVNYDLEDTTGADLSKNKLGELPQDVCSYLSLRTLNCYNNFIRAIPFEIINLTALTYLNLSRNQLSTLPVHVCDLFLEVLIVSNNKLVSLPPEIGKMKTLMHLDASCNELSTLPLDIGGTESLKELNVRRNQLVTVPEEISNLSLVKLDLSCNKITLLPPSYRNISTLEELNVSENPLENPPAQLCIRGKIHIFKFLSKKAQKDDKHRGLYDQQDTTSWQRRNHNHPRPNWLFIKPPSESPPSLNIKSRTFPEIDSDQSNLFYPPGSPPKSDSIASMANELAFFDDKMGELRRGLTGADSGYIEGDKRWSSSETSNEDEEARQLAERAAQQKEWRQNRGNWQQKIIDSRSYQPQENITFIDAGVEERTSENEPTPVQSPTVTPKPTPIQTPTMSNDVDPFTKVNISEEELARQKANYEDQKRRAREERLRKEMEEAKAQQRLETPPHMVNHIPPHVNGIHSPTKGSPPSHMNGPTTVISPNGQLANGPTSIKVNGQINGPTVDPVRTPPAGTQTRPVISTTVVKEALVVDNTVNETSSKPLSERRRDDTTRTAINKPQNGTTNGALSNNSVQRRTMSTSAVSEPAKKVNASTNPPKSQQRRATTGITSLREPVQNGPTTKVVSNGPTKKASDGVTIGGTAISQERHEAQLARRKKEEEKQKMKQQQKDAVMNYVKRASSKTTPPASSTTSSAQKTTLSTERRNSGGRPSSRLSNSSSVSNSSQRSGSAAPSSSSSSYADSAFGSIKPRSAFSISTNKSSNEKQPTNFTVKREMRQLKEEMDRIEQLKKSQHCNILNNVVSQDDIKAVQQAKKYIEARLKVTLSEDLPGELMDGVKLCHLINHVRPHAVSMIYLPAGANKLTAAKCRRNVDNFVKACQQAGVPKDKLCTSADILEGKGLAKVALTVIALMQIHGSSRSSYVAS